MIDAETRARERLANNGRNPANGNAGIRVGSDLHLCEMLLTELDRTRSAWLRLIQGENDCTPDGAPCRDKCACELERQGLVDASKELPRDADGENASPSKED